MSRLEQDEPRLLFFRSTPDDLADRPPLASSLQSFESCLLLAALERLPHAFAASVFAAESALKAAFRYSSRDKTTLEQLLNQARTTSDVLRTFSGEALDEMRRTRNEFIHYGFNSKDDKRSAEILLRTAFPFLQATYASLLGFSLDDGLLPEFAWHVGLAVRLFRENAQIPGANSVSFLAALSHLVRWSVKDSLSASWELEAADEAESHGAKFDVVEARKAKAEARLGPCWSFDCPICHGIETFVCQLSENALDQNRVAIVRGVCADCELVAPPNAPGLAHALCEAQVTDVAQNILRDYGIE